MDSRINRQIVDVCPTGPPNSIAAQESERWCDSKHATIRHLESPSYKFHNEIVENGIVDMPMDALWWREGLENFPENSESVHREEDRINECSLENCLTPQESPETGNDIPGEAVKRKTSNEQRDRAKRKKQPEMWKVNINKNARLRGEQYVGIGGKIIAAKVMGAPCDCRMRCTDKISEKTRGELHDVFWKTYNWQQRRQYIAMLVKESATQRTRWISNSKTDQRRRVTFTYSLLINDDFLTVCKLMFLSTFSISEKLVRLATVKKKTSPGGIIGDDQRGRRTPVTKKSEAVRDIVRQHIKSFPAEGASNKRNRGEKKYLDASLSIAGMHKLYVNKCKETGVTESDIVKESFYREIFKTEFNLGFKTRECKTKN